MRILINDFGGYAFIFQLSQKLALEGYDVTHVYLKSLQTPQGNLQSQESLKVIPITFSKTFNKYSFVKRIQDEKKYASAVNRIIAEKKPDVVISANTPLIAQVSIQRKCLKSNISFIFWCQDLHSIAIEEIIRKKLGKLPAYFGNAAFKKLEVSLLKRSDVVISIASSFTEQLLRWGVSENKILQMPNWSSLVKANLSPKKNKWSIKNNLSNGFCITYTGTLGFKHNPEVFILLAKYLDKYPDIRIVIISEGLGAEFLKNAVVEEKISNLQILPYQPYEDLEMIFGMSDLLFCTLEESASLYSVPSKVLTYLSVGKPIICYMNPQNLSAQIVSECGAGIVVPSNNLEQLFLSVETIYNNQSLAKEMGIAGINYAKRNFDIDNIYQNLKSKLVIV